ncbi:DUF6344 domain-containing protein [Streptomyces sp. NPDC008313]|uniref:DUF6344 domain-containing protein n=1 Tax=Streptomyces sp. NPDC008313 TaxID=3364826 RepID=UPI0036F00847
MTQNKVMKLWTAVVTAFLALCTALGLITTAAAGAVPQDGPSRNSAPQVTVPSMAHWTVAYSHSLPPTMKQRIHAEAHGSSPSCRLRPQREDGTDADDQVTAEEASARAAQETGPGCEAPLRH